MERLKLFVHQYKHGFIALGYLFVYLIWFFWLESTVTRHFNVIHTALDDYIPFCEVFVIPYFLWFGYVTIVVLYLIFHNKQDYYKACAFLFTGMTIFLVVSTIWPNGQYLRPFVMPRDNIFTRMVSGLYFADTPTNLWPSIHVYNSIGAHLAITHNKELMKRRWIRPASFILCVSIIMSTMFIKQHSAFDVVTAFIMAGVMYVLVYQNDAVMAWIQSARAGRKSRPQIGWNGRSL